MEKPENKPLNPLIPVVLFFVVFLGVFVVLNREYFSKSGTDSDTVLSEKSRETIVNNRKVESWKGDADMNYNEFADYFMADLKEKGYRNVRMMRGPDFKMGVCDTPHGKKLYLAAYASPGGKGCNYTVYVEAPESATPSNRKLPMGVPEPPSGKRIFLIHRGGKCAALYETFAPNKVIIAEMEKILTARGWKRDSKYETLMNRASDLKTAFFRKEKRICIISIEESPTTTQANVTIVIH